MKGSYFVPQVGQVYQNRNDRSYLCLSVEKRPLLNDTTAQMRRTSDGWTLTAHGLIRYENGTIEWNYSISFGDLPLKNSGLAVTSVSTNRVLSLRVRHPACSIRL